MLSNNWQSSTGSNTNPSNNDGQGTAGKIYVKVDAAANEV